MGALAIPAAVVTRLGPFIGRLSPALVAKAVTYLRSAGIVIVDGASGMIKYVKDHPGEAAMIVTALASVGAAVSDLFSSKDKEDHAVRATAGKLAVKEAEAHGHVEDARIAKAGSASETLKAVGFETKEDRDLLKDVLRFARSYFGTEARAQTGHRMLQAYLELPFAIVQAGFEDLNLD